MSVCSLENIDEISDAIVEYFELRKITPDTYNTEKLEKFVADELDFPYFKLKEYLKLPEGEEEAIRLFDRYLNSNVSDFVSGTSVKDITKSNVSKEFSSNSVTDLFHTLPLAKSYFEGEVNGKIIKEILIGDASKDTYVANSMELSANLNNLKNKLFIDIQKFLIGTGDLTNSETFDLYDDKGNVKDYDFYKAVMNKLNDYFFNGVYNTVEYNGIKVPNINDDLNTSKHIYDAYNAGILLSNFDSVLNTYFHGLVDINFNYFNNLTSNIGSGDKYTLKIEGIKTAY